MLAFRPFLATLCGVLLLPLAAHAQTALSYSRSYLITGDYAVGSVDVAGFSTGGFVTAAIPISGVPADADILAAFLYWETITTVADPSAAAGVTFRGHPIDVDDVSTVRRSSAPLSGQTASCWTSGSPLAMHAFRADVLRFLPFREDANGSPTGKRVVNTADLTAHDLPAHTVKLPKFGTGNQVPETAGASLVVVYRDPTPDSPQYANPLRKVVIYDGIHVQLPDETTTHTLQGFYQSAATKSARVTHIAASGQKNATDRILFNGTLLATDGFGDSATASERGWASPTYAVSPYMPGTSSAEYGETATTSVTHQKNTPYECLSWGAVIFSTAVADVDRDGLPDGIEDAVSGLKEPNGVPLPNLNAMGASSLHKDLFVEMNAMWAAPGTTYGSVNAPASPTTPQVVDAQGHIHMPTPVALKMLGDALRDAPFTNADGSPGITVHIDVGDIAAYRCQTGDCLAAAADDYLVPSLLARGGELIEEGACVSLGPDCQFPAYPGTVAWKSGLQWHRDAPVGDNGEALTTDDLEAWSAGTVHRKRFDPSRRGLFHYVLYAHARAKPRSPFPCVDALGAPVAYATDGACAVGPNPLFHVPTSASGRADLPGGDAMITLGFWDNFVGTPFVQASTTLHELGHHMDLWHGGLPAAWGNAALGSTTFIEPSCKTNHLSIMSYLFQVHGLLDDDGDAHLDYSRDVYQDIDETLLFDASLSTPLRYRAAWFAPLVPGSMGFTLGFPAAKRFCPGAKLPDPLPDGWVDFARIDAPLVSTPVDWNADGDATDSAFVQDVNFDGVFSGTLAAPATALLRGTSDWASVRMDQAGAGQHAAGLSSGGISLDDVGGGISLDDVGGGISIDDIGGGIWLDDVGGGISLDDVGGGISLDDVGGGISLDDVGGGISLDDVGGGAELELDTVKAWGNTPPKGLRACILGLDCPDAPPPPFTPQYHRVQARWSAPNVAGGPVSQYRVFRATGGTITPASGFSQVGSVATTTFVDDALPDGIDFTYLVRAVSADAIVSGPSNLRTVTAVNDAPVTAADAYTAVVNTTLVVPVAAGVLANDTDVDTPASSIRAVVVSGPSSGVLALSADGSFTFVPARGFTGQVSFSYLANNGVWNLDPTVPMSADSAPATVTITVVPRLR